MQVSSATATFVMIFSSSMSAIQYYLLRRFPVPYGKENSEVFHWYLSFPLDQSQTWSILFFFFFSFSIFLDALFYLYRAALYFVAVATVAALVGQHVVRKIISIVGRASVIIFVLAFTIFISALTLGKFLLYSFPLHILSHLKLSLYDSFPN